MCTLTLFSVLNTDAPSCVQVVDTPGLFDTEVSHESSALNLVQAVDSLSPGPHAVLFVTKIGRFTDEEFSAYEQVNAIFGSAISKHMIIIFTGGDFLKRDNTHIEDCLKRAPDQLQNMLQECGNRYVVFDNTAQDKKSQADLLLAKVDELKKKHGNEPFRMPYIENPGDDRIKEMIAKRLKALGVSETEHEDEQLTSSTINLIANISQLDPLIAILAGIVGTAVFKMGSWLEHVV